MIRRSQKAPGSSLGVFDITRHHRQGLRRMHPDRLHRKSPTGNEVTCTVSPEIPKKVVRRMAVQGRRSDQANARL